MLTRTGIELDVTEDQRKDLRKELDSISSDLYSQLDDVEIADLVHHRFHTRVRLSAATEEDLFNCLAPGTASLLWSKLHPGQHQLRLRFSRRRGAQARPLSLEEVHHIVTIGDSSLMACLHGHASHASIASTLTALAHQPCGGVAVIGVDGTTTPAAVAGCSHSISDLENLLRTLVTPELSCSIKGFTIGGKHVIGVDVAPAQKAHGVRLPDGSLHCYKRCCTTLIEIPCYKLDLELL